MPTEGIAWSREDAEAVIVHALAVALALKQKLSAEDLARIPLLSEFLILAHTIAGEIGWGDEPNESNENL